MKTDVRRLSLIPFVHRATHRIGLWLDAAQPALRVTQGEAHLLAHLAEAGTSSVKALHSAFAHKRSSLTSYLDRLEGRGYVLRALHPKDRRSFLVSLTPAGAAAAAAHPPPVGCSRSGRLATACAPRHPCPARRAPSVAGRRRGTEAAHRTSPRGVTVTDAPVESTPSRAELLRASRVAVQTWNATPERLLPLLTPLGEKAWAVGWEPEMRWQPAGGQGAGTLFVTRGPGGGETVWVLETFDVARQRVAYVHVSPGSLVVEIGVTLAPLPENKTRAEVRYTFTALSELGNARIAQVNEADFENFMRDWERELNHFLQTGRKLDAPSA